MKLLHSDGTPYGVDVVRLLVFSVCAAGVSVAPFQEVDVVLAWILRLAGAGSCLLAAAGAFAPGSVVAATICVCLAAWLGRLWGAGYDPGILFALSAVLLAGSSLIDWMALRAGHRATRAWGARLTLITLAALFVFSHQIAALQRILTLGFGGMLGDTSWLPSGAGPLAESRTLRTAAHWSFLSMTLVELILPLALFLRRGRWLFAALLTALHIVTFLTTQTGFPQILLVVLLLDVSRWAAPRASLVPPIVFFDGVCALCEGLVKRVIRWDRSGVLRFAPLQGATAKAILIDEHAPRASTPNSIIMDDDGGPYQKSEAVLKIWQRLGGAFRVYAIAARLVPRAVRDLVYDLIASHRYRIFGRREVCYLPPPEQMERFLP